MPEYFLSAEPTHSRWNRALPPRLRIATGDTVHLECVDSSSSQVRPGMTVAEYGGIDRGSSLACWPDATGLQIQAAQPVQAAGWV